MNKEQQFNELFGDESTLSEHKTGDIIRFMDKGIEKIGKIVHVMAPGETVGGIQYSIRYVWKSTLRGSHLS